MYISGLVPLEGLSQGTYSVFQMLVVVQLLMYNLNLKMTESDRQTVNILPWLVWLSGLSASLQTKGLLESYPDSQGMCLGCGQGSLVKSPQEATTH